ncbi:MAG TPA: CoA-binding protein [Bacteroidetes bacterium]|nr:CoA-binding protein [Bacteroidota bacterium]
MEYTLVLGASPNPRRFSYKAVKSLVRHNYPVVAVGFRPGMIGDIEILTGRPPLKNIHTIALYLGPERQKDMYDYILDLNPRRIIFNPGTENDELMEKARSQGIEPVTNCALIMLNNGNY